MLTYIFSNKHTFKKLLFNYFLFIILAFLGLSNAYSNTKPTADSIQINVTQNTKLYFSVTANDTDQDTLIYTIVNEPEKGTVSINNSGICLYTPESDAIGEDVFTYKVNDGTIDSDTANVQITINEIPVVKIIKDKSFLVPVAIDNIFEIYGIDIRCEFSQSNIQANGTTFQDTVLYNKNYDITENTTIEGQARFSIYASAGLFKGSGKVLNINFDNLSNVGESTIITLTRLILNEKPVTGGFFINNKTYWAVKLQVNNPPQAVSAEIEGNEDTEIQFTLQGNDLDSSDNLTYTLVSNGEIGKATITDFNQGNGIYVPEKDKNGLDVIEFIVSDGFENSASGSLEINIIAQNDNPVSYPDTITINEDSPFNYTLSADDIDSEIQGFNILSTPEHGKLTQLDDNSGRIIYMPDHNYSGLDSFSFNSYDESLTSLDTIINITILPVNDIPIANSNFLTLNEDSYINYTLTAFDEDSEIVSYTIVKQPLNGQLIIENKLKGTIKYNPQPDYYGEDSFTFKAYDGEDWSQEAKINLNIFSINDPPEAISGSIKINEDTIGKNKLESSDIDSVSITYFVEKKPRFGEFLLSESGNFTYTPENNFYGEDSFIFKVYDQELWSEPANYTIIIKSQNDPPEALSKSINVIEDITKQFLLSAEDIDSTIRSFSITGEPQNGILTLINPEAGLCEYTSKQDFNGIDSFTFTASDMESTSEPATVTITITPANDSPIANSMSLTVTEDTTESSQLTGKDIDEDILFFKVIQKPEKGNVNITDPVSGEFQYIPNKNENGQDSFSFIVNDGTLDSTEAFVSIQINEVNDPPVALNGDLFIEGDELFKTDILSANDIEHDSLLYTIVSEPEKGTVTILNETTGLYTYERFPDIVGTDSFQFKVNDGKLDSNIATVNVSINPPDNKRPVAYPKSITAVESVETIVELDAYDEDGDMLTYHIIKNGLKGNAVIEDSETNQCIYTPSINAQGIDSFKYYVSDGRVNSDPATITVSINQMPRSYIAQTESLKLPVSLDEKQNIQAVEIEISYNEQFLNAIDASFDGGILENKNYSLSKNIQNPGIAKFSLVASSEIVNNKGVVLNVIFDVLSEGGDSIVVKLNKITLNEKNTKGGLYLDNINSPVFMLIVNNNTQVFNGFFYLDEDSFATYNLVAIDPDITDNLSYTIVSNPSKGELTLIDEEAGVCKYVPYENMNGEDSFSYKAFDGKEYSDKGMISITIFPINDPPAAMSETIETNEDEEIIFNLKASDIDEFDVVYFKLGTKPAHGSISINKGSGQCKYIPSLDFFGKDSFIFTASDGITESEPGFITINVLPANDPPTIFDIENKSILEDLSSSISITVMDMEGGQIVLSASSSDQSVIPSSNIKFKLSDTNTLTYNSNANEQDIIDIEITPLPNKTGIVKITINATDSENLTNIKTFDISIGDVNDPPTISQIDDQTYRQGEPVNPIIFSTSDIDTVSYELTLSFETSNTDLIPEENFEFQGESDERKLIINPEYAFSGNALITITVFDGFSSDSAVFNFNVYPNIPEISNISDFEIDEDNTLGPINFTIDDVIVPVENLILSAKSSDETLIPEDSIIIEGTGKQRNITIKPAQNKYGIAFITLTVDNGTNKATDMFQLSIASINDTPIAINKEYTTEEEISFTGTLEGEDVDSDIKSFSIFSTPEKGKVKLLDSKTGEFSYEPLLNKDGYDYFEYISFDGSLYSEPAKITITITPINDPPVFLNMEIFEIDEDSVSNTIKLNIDDPDSDELEITAYSINDDLISNSTIEVNSLDKLLVVTPNNNQNGMTEIMLTVSDNYGLTASGQITISVAPVNDPPVAVPGESQVIKEGEIVNLDASQSYDIDGDNLSYEWSYANDSQFIIEFTDKSSAKTTFKAPDVGEQGDSIKIIVTVYDGKGLSASEEVIIMVQNSDPPIADFSSYPQTGKVPLSVSFSDESTNNITTWLWDFGDGFTSSIQNPEHTYSLAGTYSVSLSLIGPGGEDTIVKSGFITVEQQPLSVDFEAYPIEGKIPFTVNFSQFATGEVYEYLWDFGDGKQSIDPNPSHLYDEIGSYTVTLTVSSLQDSKSSVKENYINAKGYEIKGRITDSEEGYPLAGYRVEVLEIDKFLGEAYSDENGYYTVVNLKYSNKYVIGVFPETGTNIYYQQFYNREASGTENRLEAVYVSEDKDDLENINFALQRVPVAGIKGFVHDGSQNPISGIQVDAFSQTLLFGLNTKTDENGYYTIIGLKPSDDYLVYLWSDQLNSEFYFALDEKFEVGETPPIESAFSSNLARFVTPADPPVNNIDIIVNMNQGAKISGNVKDSNNNPLKGILVNAWSQGLNTGNNSTTDNDGNYEIYGLILVDESEVETNGYIVEIQGQGYQYQAFNNVFEKSEAAKVYTGRDDVNFTLKDKSFISGIVTNKLGEPLQDAEISAWSISDIQKQGNTISDSSGNYQIDNLPVASDYIIEVFKTGYPVTYYASTQEKDEANPIDLTFKDASDINIKLDKGAVISGDIYLQTQDQKAPAGININISSESTNKSFVVSTDEMGHYEISGLDENVTDYIISIISDDYLQTYYRDNFDTDPNNDTVNSFESAGFVQADVEPINRNLILSSGYTARGKVFYTNANEDILIKDVKIVAESQTGGYAQTTSVLCDCDYNYTLTGLSPGTYKISLSHDEFINQIIENTDIYSDTDGLDFTLSKEPTRFISGTISGLESGKELQVSALSLANNFNKTLVLTGTGDDLNYSLDELRPLTDYIVEISSNDYPYQVYNEKLNPDDADIIDLSQNDAYEINFTLAGADDLATIYGTIEFPTSALNGEKVRIQASSSSTNSEGFVELTFNDNDPYEKEYEITGLLKVNDFIISIISEFYQNTYYDGETAEGSLSSDDAVLIDTNTDNEINFSLSKGASIIGKITDQDGNALAGINVEAWSEKSSTGGSSETDSDGNYRIEGLVDTDDFVVKAVDSNNIEFFYNVDQTVRNKAIATNLSTNDIDPENINIIISPGESISGSVRDIEGKPIANIWVNAWSDVHQTGNGIFTSSDGSFILKGLPKSRDYSLTAKPDWSMPYVEKELGNISSGSQGIGFNLKAKTGFVVKGKVTDNLAAIVKNARVEIKSESDSTAFGWALTDRQGQYSIDLLPEKDDYIVSVTPPSDSSLGYYSEKRFSISGSAIKNIMLTTGMKISGIIYDDNQIAFKAAYISLWSDSFLYFAETFSNKEGLYTFSNLPNASDYVITVKTEEFMESKKTNESPGDGIDFYLEKSGSITGLVKEASTGKVVSGVTVEVYSKSFEGIADYSGVATTDENGMFELASMKPYDQNGNILNDFVVTAIADGYPPIAKSGKKMGDTVDFSLSSGPENEIRGSVLNGAGAVIIVDIYDDAAKFIKSLIVAKDNTFLIDGLMATKLYKLKFIAFKDDQEIEEWAGQDNLGVVDPADSINYNTNITVDFSFSNTSFFGRKSKTSLSKSLSAINNSSIFRNYKLGPVRNLKSLSHDFVYIDNKGRAIDSSGSSGKPSNDPNVTVAWDPPEEGSANVSGYYSEFGSGSNFEFKKLNTIGKPPVKTRKITSEDLAGDDLSFYFYVAPIDKEGRLGPTTSIAFRIDTVPPTNVSAIAPESTNNRNINLTLGATGATEMFISNLSYKDGGTWENQITAKNWKISQGGGKKKLYVRFRDNAGNTANTMTKTEFIEPLPEFNIIASSGENGNIEPSGNIVVSKGSVQTFNFIPDSNYKIDKVMVDDALVDSSLIKDNKYSFINITQDYKIQVSFKPANYQPVANNLTFVTNEDETLYEKLTGSDADQNPLSYQIVNYPDMGTLEIINQNTGDFSYKADNDTFGTINFSFKVNDGTVDSESAQVTIIINPLNDQPQAFGKVLTGNVDQLISLTLDASDVDNDPLTYILIDYPNNGSLETNFPNVTYTPYQGFKGLDRFSYKVNDGTLDSNIAYVEINIGADTAINEDTENLKLNIPENATLEGDINEIKTEKGTLKRVEIQAGIYEFIYTPDKNASGEDSFKYLLDGKEQTHTIYIINSNDPPEILFNGEQPAIINEDTTLSISITTSDIDGDNVQVTYTHSCISIDSQMPVNENTKYFIYKPVENFYGVDELSFSASDGFSTTQLNIEVNINPVNDRPTANSSNQFTNERTSLNFDLTGNDIEGTALSFTIVTEPENGELTIDGKSCIYTPYLTFWGRDFFEFTATDGELESEKAKITINVGFPDYAKTSNFYTNEDVPLTLSSQTDLDEITGEYYMPLDSHGTIDKVNLKYQYYPEINFNGITNIKYVSANSESILLTIFVKPVNDPPIIEKLQTVNVDEDTEQSITVKVINIDNDPKLQYTIIKPENGSIIPAESENIEIESCTSKIIAQYGNFNVKECSFDFVYKPDYQYSGQDKIIVNISDYDIFNEKISSNEETINISINSVNDIPYAFSQNIKSLEDEPANITLTGKDIDGSIISYEVKHYPLNGKILDLNNQIIDPLNCIINTTIGNNAYISYVPNNNYNGKDYIVYAAKDDNGSESQQVTITINIQPVNDIPAANPFNMNISEENQGFGQMSASDVDNDMLIYRIVNQPEKGNVVVTNPISGNFIYYPDPNSSGMDYFSYYVSDGRVNSNVAIASIFIKESPANLTKLKVTVSGDYVNGDSYSFIIINNGNTVRESSNIKINSFIQYLEPGNYRLIIYGKNYEPFEYEVDNSPFISIGDSDKNIPVNLIKSTIDELDTPKIDISHSIDSNGLTLKARYDEGYTPVLKIVNKHGSEITAIKNINIFNQILTYSWIVNQDTYTEKFEYSDIINNNKFKDIEIGLNDTIYNIVFKFYQGQVSNNPLCYTVTFIEYQSSEYIEKNKPQTQIQFEKTYGKASQVTMSEHRFYPLTGIQFWVMLKNNSGDYVNVPVYIPSIPLEFLFIDNFNIFNENYNTQDNLLNYYGDNNTASKDYYNIDIDQQNIHPEKTDILIAKVSFYTFGNDSVGNGLNIELELASGLYKGSTVRYNPIINSSGQRSDVVFNEKAPNVILPLILNNNSLSYSEIRDKIISEKSLAFFINERGDGTIGFRKENLTTNISDDNESVVLVETNHLTSVGFSVSQPDSSYIPPCSQCEDESSGTCFIETTYSLSKIGLLFLLLFLLIYPKKKMFKFNKF